MTNLIDFMPHLLQKRIKEMEYKFKALSHLVRNYFYSDEAMMFLYSLDSDVRVLILRYVSIPVGEEIYSNQRLRLLKAINDEISLMEKEIEFFENKQKELAVEK